MAEPAMTMPAPRSSIFSVRSAGADATRVEGMRNPTTAAARKVTMASPSAH